MPYHYTDFNALHSIVKNRKVWFSSLAFMNDELEGLELHNVLSTVLRTDYHVGEFQDKLKLIETIIDTHLRFQLCFSSTRLPDDISQWRAYTEIGSGIAIEFEDGFVADARAKKLECLYTLDEKRDAIARDSNLWADDIRTNSVLSTTDGIEGYLKSIISTLVRFKHASFRPEDEVRWVISIDGINEDTTSLDFRAGRFGLALYEEIDVDLSKVKSITLGPQVPRQNLKTVEDFLILHGCSGYITKSQVTLR